MLFYFDVYVCIACMCVNVLMSCSAHRGQKKSTLGSPGTGVMLVAMWVLGIEPGSSTRATSAL